MGVYAEAGQRERNDQCAILKRDFDPERSARTGGRRSAAFREGSRMAGRRTAPRHPKVTRKGGNNRFTWPLAGGLPVEVVWSSGEAVFSNGKHVPCHRQGMREARGGSSAADCFRQPRGRAGPLGGHRS